MRTLTYTCTYICTMLEDASVGDDHVGYINNFEEEDGVEDAVNSGGVGGDDA